MRGRDADAPPRRRAVARSSTCPGRRTTRRTGDARARSKGRVVLAGGLGPENVAAAIAAVGRGRWTRARSARARARASRITRASRAYVEAAEDERGHVTFGAIRRAVRPGDADPGARRARPRAGTQARPTPRSQAELDQLGREYAGRPTPLTLAERFAPGKRLYLKREDLNHTGAHKLNNALGQAVLARRLGKQRIIAETGAGQHGVATATVCARFGLECVVYMGSEDMRRQRPTSSGWGCSAPRCARSSSARRR